MNFTQQLEAVRSSGDYAKLIELIPYACLLGVRVEKQGDDLLFLLPFDKQNIGNSILPALHGGVIGGFMENAALIHLMSLMETTGIPKTVDFSIDYLRSGRPQTTFAHCYISRLGKRVAHVSIDAWQEDVDKPIATARAHFLLA